MYNFDQWNGFFGSQWKEEVNVRDFIQQNYTPYTGEGDFLAGPTEDTTALWDEVKDLMKKEIDAGGLLDADTEVVSTIVSHAAGYSHKGNHSPGTVIGGCGMQSGHYVLYHQSGFAAFPGLKMLGITSRIILCGLPIAVGVVAYALAAVKIKVVTREDCLLLPKGEKIAKLLHL